MESLDLFLLVAATISFPATIDTVAVDGRAACDVEGRASRLKMKASHCLDEAKALFVERKGDENESD
jgi:hypothetical protein